MKRISLLFILVFIGATACQKIFEKPQWQTDVVAPLVKTSLGIDNILKDTSLFSVDGDTIKFISRQKITDINLDTLVKLTVKPFEKNVKLSTLKLDSQTIIRKITLGELARAMIANGDPNGQLILDNHGNSMPFVPPISNLTAGPLDVDINQFFEYAVMNNPGGTMDIDIANGLPLNITRVEFELKNKTLVTPPIAHQVFSNLNKNTNQMQSVDLSDKTMEGNLVVNVLDMDLAGGFNVPIDTNNAITITLTIKDVSVKEAIAIFPAQDVVDEKNETSLEGMGDTHLRLARIQTGIVEAEAYSTAEDTIYFTYAIPSATKGVQPFIMKTKINPAPPGGTMHQTFSADFSGYDLDLTGKKTTYNSNIIINHDTNNTFYNEITGSIQYTGIKRNLSLTDSLYIIVTLKDVKSTYVSGYLGRDTIDIGAGSIDFDVFNKIESGILNFEKVKISLVVENGLGVDGKFNLNSLNAINTKTGDNRPGTPTSDIIAKATDNPYTSATTNIVLGGNPVDLLNILPDKINYDVQLTVNNTAFDPLAPDYSDFAYNTSTLSASVDIELPLSITADQLVLSDTVDFVSENFKTSVNQGSFTVNINNGFPLDGDLKMYFLDQNETVIDSVISAGSILSAVVNAQNRVTEKRPSKASFFVDANRMQNILRSRKVVFKVKFSTTGATTPANSFVTIFSDYSVDFKLIGDFNYTIK